MATYSAVLSVLAEANTTRAVSSLKRLDHSLDAVDRRSVSATTRTRNLGRASGSAGKALGSAARYAVGAAAAYISIAKAKEAVTTTQDLAKTTAGLNRNLGFTVKRASEWAAVAKSRDVDPKSLTMSFTTLSRRLVDTAAAMKEGGGAAQTAMAPFARLGLSQEDVAKGSKDLSSFLPKLANAFGEAGGGAERQASAQMLLGRGYQSLLPLFADGAKGLKEQQQWADKYGATLNDKTLKAQMDLVSAQRESKVAWLGLQMVFAKAVTPALKTANEQFQRIAKIIGNDKLTNAEKWKKIGDIIGKWADKAFDAFVEVLPKLAEKAGQGGLKIAGALVEGFLNAPILGKLALGGWFFKMLGGGSAIKAIGGRLMGGLFGGRGPLGGGGVVSSMKPVPVVVTNPGFGGAPGGGGKPTGGFFGKVGGFMKNAGLVGAAISPDVLAVALLAAQRKGKRSQRASTSAMKEREPFGGDTFWEGVNKRADETREHIQRVRRAIEKPVKTGLGFAAAIQKDAYLTRENVGNILKSLGELPKGARQKAAETAIGMAKALEDKGKLPEGSASRLRDEVLRTFGDLKLKGVSALADLAKKGGVSMDDLRKASRRLKSDATKDTGELSNKIGKGIGDIGRYFDQGGKKMDDLGDKSGKLKSRVGGNMDSLTGAIMSGMGQIGSATNKALKAFGVKTLAFDLGASIGEGAQKNQRGGIIRAAMGTLVPGRGNGDRVPAMLEPGEVVINKRAVAALGGARRANSINAAIPRFAGGGEVGKGGRGDKGVGDLRSPFDVMGSGPGFVPLMNFLNANTGQGKLVVISGSRPGSTVAGTGTVSNHSAGNAVDISTPSIRYLSGLSDQLGQANPKEVAIMDATNAYLQKYLAPPIGLDQLWRTSAGGGHWNHIHKGINPKYGQDENAMIDLLLGLPGGTGLAGTFEKIKRQILKGPDGPLKDLGQAALDKVRGAANRFLAKKAGTAQATAGGGTKPLGGKSGVYTASWYGPIAGQGPHPVGAGGVPMSGNMFAELNMGNALGGLPFGGKIGVTYKGRTIQVEKQDIGAGGPGLNGHLRAVDLWQEAAAQLPGLKAAGLADVEVSGLRRGGIVGKIARMATGGAAGRPIGSGGAPGGINLYRNYKAFANWGRQSDEWSGEFGEDITASNWYQMLDDYADARGLDPQKLSRIHSLAHTDPKYYAWYWKWRRGQYKRGGIAKRMAEGGTVLVGDSLTHGMIDNGGFPSGWRYPDKGSMDNKTPTWGAARMAEMWKSSDLASVFPMGSNGTVGDLRSGLRSVKKTIGNAGLALMTLAGGEVRDLAAKNNAIKGFGADAVAPWAENYDGPLHPGPSGYQKMRSLVRAAGQKAKNAAKGSGGDGGHGYAANVDNPFANTDNPFTQSPLASPPTHDPHDVPDWAQLIAITGGTGEPFKTIKYLAQLAKDAQGRIDHQAIMDAFSWSPGGTDLSEGERANEINLWDALIGILQQTRGMLPRAIHKAKPIPKLQKTLKTMLTALDDPLAGEGSILAALQGKDALVANVPEVDTARLDEIRQLKILDALDYARRYNVSQAQYAVLNGMQTGGVAGMPQVGTTPPSAASNADVRVYNYADGRTAVTVNGQSFDAKVEKVNRRAARKRPMPGVRG